MSRDGYPKPGRGRASGKPRGGGQQRYRLPPARELFEGVSPEVVQKVELAEAADAEDVIGITDCSYIGSYNWEKQNNLHPPAAPVILIPGFARVWSPKELPYSVEPDKGVDVRNENGYRMPKMPLLPLVIAVNKCQEDLSKTFDWPSVDFVTDRKNLSLLTNWANGKSDDFRIDLQLVGEKTILMSRWSAQDRSWTQNRQYRYNFKKAFTSLFEFSDAGDIGQHQRIVAYNFGGLKMVVRFGVDACLDPDTPPLTAQPDASTNFGADITDGLGSLSIDGDKRFGISIQNEGSSVKDSSLIEISTRSKKGSHLSLNTILTQLFFSQIPQHHLAIHSDGEFSTIQVVELESPISREVTLKRLQPALRKMKKVLEAVRELVQEHGETGRLSLVCQKKDLCVYERENDDSMLPEEAIVLFN